MAINSARYLLDDHPRTLFPLDTTRIAVEQGSDRLHQHIQEHIKPGAKKGNTFPPQLRCHAAKRGLHLRRTAKLDPVAELFVYDLVLRNRKHFKADTRKTRRQYGYYFESGEPASAMTGYREFKRDVVNAENRFAFELRLDVAAYFNSIYHHDLVNYFIDSGWPPDQTSALDRFLSETTGGRSIDCLPHGLHPCKVLGAAFLHIGDRSSRIESPLMLRFLDDIHLFADDEIQLWADFIELQKLLGEKALSLNAEKTEIVEKGHSDLEAVVDDIKLGLLRVRSEWIEVSGETKELEMEEYESLTDEQTEYLLDLLRDSSLDESDAELVLTLLSEHGEEVLERMSTVWPQYPSLSKPIYNFVTREFGSGSSVIALSKAFLTNAPNATEYQLFWLTKILQVTAPRDEEFGNLLTAILDHPHATPIVQAKVLEIADNRFGLAELRESVLKRGQSDWPSIAAMVGCRVQSKASRNKLIKNCGSVSPLNKVIAEIAMGLDQGKPEEPQTFNA